jgi:hypothetical protein
MNPCGCQLLGIRRVHHRFGPEKLGGGVSLTGPAYDPWLNGTSFEVSGHPVVMFP